MTKAEIIRQKNASWVDASVETIGVEEELHIVWSTLTSKEEYATSIGSFAEAAALSDVKRILKAVFTHEENWPRLEAEKQAGE